MPFASLLAFQPVITNYSPAPDAFPQTATFYRAGALPHGITLPSDCHWKWVYRLDERRRSFPQVTAYTQWQVLKWSEGILQQFFALLKAFSQGD